MSIHLDVKKASKAIFRSTRPQPIGIWADLKTFKAMGIDAKKYGEHQGGGVYLYSYKDKQAKRNKLALS